MGIFIKRTTFRAARRRRRLITAAVIILALAALGAGSYYLIDMVSTANAKEPIPTPAPTPNPLEALAASTYYEAAPEEIVSATVFPNDSIKLDIKVDKTGSKLYCVEELTYTNSSDVALEALMLRAYPNALHDLSYTPYTEEADFSSVLTKGTGSQMHFNRVLADGESAQWTTLGKYRTTFELELKEPLPPGETVSVLLDFSFTMPAGKHFLGSGRRYYQYAWFCLTPAEYESVEPAYSDDDWRLSNIHTPGFGSPWYSRQEAFTALVHVPSDLSMACTGSVLSTYNEGAYTVYCVEGGALRTFAFGVGPKGRNYSAEEGAANITAYSSTQEKSRSVTQLTQGILRTYAPVLGEYSGALSLFPAELYAKTFTQPGLILVDAELLGGTAAKLELQLAKAVAALWFGGEKAGDPSFDALMNEYLAGLYLEENQADQPYAHSEGAQALRELRVSVGTSEFNGAILAALAADDGVYREAFISAFDDPEKCREIMGGYAPEGE